MEDNNNKIMSVEAMSAYLTTAADIATHHTEFGAMDGLAPITSARNIHKNYDGTTLIKEFSKEINVPDVESIKMKMKELRMDLINIRHNVAMNDIYAGSDSSMSDLWSSNSSFYEARLKEAQANLEREINDLRERKDIYEQYTRELENKEQELAQTIDMFNHYSNDGSMPAYEVDSYINIEKELQDEKSKIESSLDGGIDKVVSMPVYKDEAVDREDECYEAINILLEIYHGELPKARFEHDNYAAALVNLEFEQSANQAMYDKMIHEHHIQIKELKAMIIDETISESERLDAKAEYDKLLGKISMQEQMNEASAKDYAVKVRVYKSHIDMSKSNIDRLTAEMDKAKNMIQKCIDQGVTSDGQPIDEAFVYNMSAEKFGGSEDQVEKQQAYKAAREAYVKASQEYVKAQSEVLIQEDTVKASSIKANRLVESAKRSAAEAQAIVDGSAEMILNINKAVELHESTISFAKNEIEMFKLQVVDIDEKITNAKPSDFDENTNEDGSLWTIEQKEAAHKEQIDTYLTKKADISNDIAKREKQVVTENQKLADAAEEVDRITSDSDKAAQKHATLNGDGEGSIAELEDNAAETHSKVLDYANVKMEILNKAEADVTQSLVDLETAEQELSELEGTFESDVQFNDPIDLFDGEGELDFMLKDSKGSNQPAEIKLPKWLAKLFRTRQYLGGEF